jgi:hypothetical protein
MRCDFSENSKSICPCPPAYTLAWALPAEREDTAYRRREKEKGAARVLLGQSFFRDRIAEIAGDDGAVIFPTTQCPRRIAPDDARPSGRRLRHGAGDGMTDKNVIETIY